jgi:hypothetical protein
MNNSLDLGVTDRQSFIAFLNRFSEDYKQNKSYWENGNIESFLDAMISCTEDAQGFYNNTNQKINADVASWKVFADILMGASMYE